MDDIRTNVEIADSTGHSSLSLTKQETLDLIEMNQGSWIYKDNQMVQATDIAVCNVCLIGSPLNAMLAIVEAQRRHNGMPYTQTIGTLGL